MSDSDYVARNRGLWPQTNAEFTGPSAARPWAVRRRRFEWAREGPAEELWVARKRA